MKLSVRKFTFPIATGLIFFLSTNLEGQKEQTKKSEWTREKEEVKVMVERFLIEIGNYNEDALKENSRWKFLSLSYTSYPLPVEVATM